MGLSASLATADSFDPSSPTVLTSPEYDFTYVVGSNTFAWSLPAEPVPATNVVLGQSFSIEGVSYTLNDAVQPLGDVEFYSDALSGGLVLASYPPAVGQTYFIDAAGPVLYTGPESSPTFNTGTFSLSDVVAGATGSLTITEVGTTATPEPSTLLLTGLGVLGLFWFARKRRFTAAA